MGCQTDGEEPAQVVGQVLGGNAMKGCQEGFEPLMAVVDGLDMKLAADPLAGRLVERFMADTEVGGAARIDGGAVGDEQRVLVDGGFQHGLNGQGRNPWQHRAERGAAS
jgi:hypothetical protein